MRRYCEELELLEKMKKGAMVLARKPRQQVDSRHQESEADYRWLAESQ